MNIISALALTVSLSFQAAASPPARTDTSVAHPGRGDTIEDERATDMAELHESRLRMLEQLRQTSNPKERRQLLDDWREANQQRLDAQLEQAASRTQASVKKHTTTWTRPAIPEDVPAEERARLELRYDLMEARQQMLTKMEGACPQERRQAMEEFRKQTAAHRARMEVVSGLSTQSDTLAVRDDRLASGSRSQAREPLPVLPVPDNASPEVKARLQARNTRIDAINTLQSAMNNASPQERRAAIDAYREKIKALQDAQEKTERALPDTRAPEAAVSAH